MSENIWNIQFKKLGKAYIDYFQTPNADPIAFIESIAKYPSLTSSLNIIYGIYVREQKIVPIEKLEKEEKQELWEEAKRITPINGLNKEDAEKVLLNVSRAIHCLGSLLQIEQS